MGGESVSSSVFATGKKKPPLEVTPRARRARTRPTAMDDAEIDQFCRVTGCDDRETATRLLNSSNGNIGDAIGAYYGAYLGASRCLPIIDRAPLGGPDNRPTLTLALSIDSGRRRASRTAYRTASRSVGSRRDGTRSPPRERRYGHGHPASLAHPPPARSRGEHRTRVEAQVGSTFTRGCGRTRRHV